MPIDNVEALNERVRERVQSALRLAGVMAHQLGGTMLPAVRSRDAAGESKAWRRLAFQTEAITDHVRRQKRGIDFFRAERAGQLDPLPLEDWLEWVWPLARIMAPAGIALQLTPETLVLDGTMLISVELSHAVVVAATAAALQCAEGSGASVHIAGDGRGITIAMDEGERDFLVPNALNDLGTVELVEHGIRLTLPTVT